MSGRVGVQTRLKHFCSYPRCPKINGYVERANRTLQEEFVNLKEDVILDSLNEFNRQLIDYLVWYNSKRVHKGLNNQTPMDYIIKNYPQECQMDGTYTRCCAKTLYPLQGPSLTATESSRNGWT